MRVLLVQAKSPPTYWGYEHSLRIARKAAALPPLGLATVAALLPSRWDVRIHDLELRPLSDSDLCWADAVLVSGMLAHSESMREVLRRARDLGRRTVAAGPGPSTSPESFPEADHLFIGEAEGRIDGLVAALESSGVPAPRVLSPPGTARPPIRLSPTPRFDLLDLRRYASLAIQVSRGCPFHCEFCDVIELFGRVPRVKSPEQVLAELDALHRLGARGPLFLVDDNFIGNRREIAKLLPRIAEWQRQRGQPFDLYTEASLDLASEPVLLQGMIDAGFTAVFVGIETPSRESLAEAGKTQNLKLDPAEAVMTLTRAGLEVFAGFILGFDSDGPDIFDRQREFISNLPIARAMVGLLTALPGTALWRRLEREGRLRTEASGDVFERPNFVPTLDERTLVEGYRELLADLYSADNYYRRCERYLESAPLRRAPLRQGSFRVLLRAIWEIGVRGPRRRHFWRLAWRALRLGPAALAPAMTLTVLGEHFIRYTEEAVLPRLDRSIEELARTATRSAAPETVLVGAEALPPPAENPFAQPWLERCG